MGISISLLGVICGVRFGPAHSQLKWPRYALESTMNIVFDANVFTHVEPDTYRKERVDFLVGKFRHGTLQS
jgi:hypothetical protein